MMPLSVTLLIVVLAAVLLLAWLWRRECKRQQLPVRPYVLWFPALLAGVSVAVFLGVGMQPGSLRLLQDINRYQPQAEKLIAGDGLDSLTQEVPLLGLIHALQAELRHQPSAPGWAALSHLYQQLSEQTQLDARGLAVVSAERAYELAPDSPDSQLLLAKALIAEQGGQLGKRSRQLLASLLATHPSYDGVWLLLAMAAAHSHDYVLAEDAFSKLLAHHPDDKATALLQKSLAKVRAQQHKRDYFGQIEVRLTLADGSDMATGGTLFVYVKRPAAGGRPLAAKRLLLTHLPLTLTLTAANWLGPMPAVGTKLRVGVRYAVGAGASVAQSRELATAALLEKEGHLAAHLELP